MVRRLITAPYKFIPNFARTFVITKYKAPVRAIAADMATGNDIPFLIIQGKAKNMGRDGNTYQKVPSEWDAIFSISLVSPYSQIIPNTEIKGREAIRLPNKGNFLATSEMRTIMVAVSKSFTEYQTIQSYPSL